MFFGMQQASYSSCDTVTEPSLKEHLTTHKNMLAPKICYFMTRSVILKCGIFYMYIEYVALQDRWSLTAMILKACFTLLHIKICFDIIC